MALNIDWRFAGPQDIKVPQSNFLNSLDKNIQKGLEIKKEFDKKRDDNEMIRLMTEESENKLAALINEKDELTTQYNLLTADEQLAQKTNYENKLKDLDEQINLARKEVTDAKMNANQFKTTGTTDFFRWKKDKEYAADVAAVNRDMLNEQIKQETLSDLSEQIKRKQFEVDNSNNKNDKKKFENDLKLLKERYNKVAGQTVYAIDGSTPKVNVTQKDDDIKDVVYINTEIESLTWEENLANSDAVKQIQDEINKYSDSDDKDKLNQALENKIVELNKAKAAEDEAERKAKAAKAEAARNAKEDAEKKLKTMYNKGEAENLLNYYLDENNLEAHRNSAKAYLIEVLGKTQYDKKDPRRDTPLQAAYTKYNDVMRRFIRNNRDAINSIQPAEK